MNWIGPKWSEYDWSGQNKTNVDRILSMWPEWTEMADVDWIGLNGLNRTLVDKMD